MYIYIYICFSVNLFFCITTTTTTTSLLYCALLVLLIFSIHQLKNKYFSIYTSTRFLHHSILNGLE